MSKSTQIRGTGSGRAMLPDRRPSRRAVRLVLVPAMLCWAIMGPACSENNGKGKGNSSNKNVNNSNSISKQNNANKRMVLSKGEYNKGYQDGKRDAAASLIDANGAWMWDWMKEAEYRQGYHQGWADGRQIKKLQAKAEEAKQQHQDKQRPQSQLKESKPQQAPAKQENQSSRANVQPAHKVKRLLTVDTKSRGQQ